MLLSKVRTMTTTQLLVLLGGLTAILGVNWYFFLAPRGRVAKAASRAGSQEATILVRGGYSPAVLTVKRGLPVRLTFDRRETSSCSEEIVIPDLGIRRFLPANQKTTVEFTPEKSGRFDFTCGMSMLRGTLIVE
jgi:plastocyanin domain-containing protein